MGSKTHIPSRWNAYPLTVDHKPELEEERKRIEERGGKVFEKERVARVVWYRPKVIGVVRRNAPVEEVAFLAVARSLGDLWSYNYKTGQFVVSPEPDVAVYNIDAVNHKCLIFASDGLWNVMDPQTAINFVNETERFNELNLRNRINNNWRNPAQFLVQKSLQKWREISLGRSDNCTVIVVNIGGNDSQHIRGHDFQQAICDYQTEEVYNLDYINPFNSMQTIQQTFSSSYSHQVSSFSSTKDQATLPPFSNNYYSYIQAGTSATAKSLLNEPDDASDESSVDLKYYTSSQTYSAFVRGCCPGQRYVLSSYEDQISYHENYEQHLLHYENMSQKKLPVLHYCYRPESYEQNKINNSYDDNKDQRFNQRNNRERCFFVPPTKMEFKVFHMPTNEDSEIQKNALMEMLRLNHETISIDLPFGDEVNHDDESVADTNDDVDMYYDDEDDILDQFTCSDDGTVSYTQKSQKALSAKFTDNKRNDSIQIYEISSSNIVVKKKKNCEEKEKNNKENNEGGRKLRNTSKRGGSGAKGSRFYETRQFDRKMRSTRVINRENFRKRTTNRSIKKVIKPLVTDTKSLKLKLKTILSDVKIPSTSTSSVLCKNKENNILSSHKNHYINKPVAVAKRVLRSSQTEMKEDMSSKKQTHSTPKNIDITKKVINIVRNLRSHTNSPGTSIHKKDKVSSSTTRKRSSRTK